MKEIHLTKKDFRIEWFSGTGSGGQHRNKHQNCCRITHIDSGIKAQSTGSKERPSNKKQAFTILSERLIKHFCVQEKPNNTNISVIRNYNESRNEVHDKKSGLKMSYKAIIDNIEPMINARRMSKNE